MDKEICGKVDITKSQFITWLISVSIFIAGIFLTTYFNVDSRIKTLEVEIGVLNTKYSSFEKGFNAVSGDLKEIKDLMHSIDKRLSITEIKGNENKKK